MTTPTITIEQQRAWIDRLTALAARRKASEIQLRQRDEAELAEARREHQRRLAAATSDFESRHARLVAQFKESREAILGRYEADGAALALEEDRFVAAEKEQHAQFVADAKTLRQHRYDEVQRAYRERDGVVRATLAQFKQQCEYSAGEVNALVVRAQGVVRRRCQWPDEAAPAEPPLPAELSQQEHLEQFSAALGRAFERLSALQNQPAARFLEDGWPLLIFVVAALASAYPLWLWLGNVGWAAGACVTLAAVLAIGIRLAIRPLARRQTLKIVPDVQKSVAEARASLAAALSAAKAAGEANHRREVERRDAELKAAKAECKAVRREQKAIHQNCLSQAAVQFVERRKTIEDKYERQLDVVEAKFPPQIQKMEQDFVRLTAELSQAYRDRLAAAKKQTERQWQELQVEWDACRAEFEQAVAAMNAACAANSQPWDAVDWQTWRPSASAESVTAIRFGQFEFRLPEVEDAGQSGQSQAPSPACALPAVLSFPGCPSLLLEAEGDGRDAATRVIQNVMLRLLAAFPPGKVRFTVIDPVGLGQNFSAFMHLADYDERLVASRIWTEAAHVQQRLADLTEHMENVIQKYLRNEFASIEEYNAHAGEVAEPFQILVVANFPANFSEEAARRLASIATSGARCGVYTLISTDQRLKLPRNFDLADLEAQGATLVWDEGLRRMCWKHDDLRPLPLALDAPPDDERFTQIVRAVGRLAKDAARVEVPFETVTPPPDKWWSGDSRGGVEVPLGRAGAKNLQYMRLGKGTSQHVLISGKTGSGKSTLLNALVTNLAVHYSPDELQFYLIDFKKGVEFKAYAQERLPHARVIAIESEREFGMSVLERLDVELKHRGDLFRQQGVQDLKGYRTAAPAAAMPRILLIIDEFQEFFTSDDRISHDAALLLDRLVRQGRAFGIHVLLGSQTLAGAYSLARSTIGQMAVRIALQCSETDAHLILSEDNTAARLLSRPGEAIYNDANGLLEGNHPFQVVWLSDDERQRYLRRVRLLADERRLAVEEPIVFEGNAAADPADNRLLRELLQGPQCLQPCAAPRAWLGAAVAIKDPTAATFRRHSGSNLLIVGQQDELALGMLANCLVSLTAQLRPTTEAAGAATPHSLYVLDGTRVDSPESGFWARLASQLPVGAKIVAPRDAAQIVAQIAAEVNRRLAASDQTAEPVFLFIHNLARFRDLKKSDDFGLSSLDDEGPGRADKHLATILREGPALGVHTLVWCDSYSNASRWLDRQTLRDFEMRVLFQMSATDSSNLMDSPAASRLGAHMAIFYSDERGEGEKLRPYGLPSPEWLSWVREQLVGHQPTIEAPRPTTALN